MAVLLYFHPQRLLFGLSGLNSEGEKTVPSSYF